MKVITKSTVTSLSSPVTRFDLHEIVTLEAGDEFYPAFDNGWRLVGYTIVRNGERLPFHWITPQEPDEPRPTD
jgi:nitrogen fixation protein